MPYKKYPLNSEELRRLAQERLAQQASERTPVLSLEQAQRLIDSLSISLIERELQSEHLEASRAQLEMSLNQNGEIYVLAPVGHFSLDGLGNITQLNHVGAKLLGLDRTQLLGSVFEMYLPEDQRAIFRLLFDQATHTGEVQSGEFTLRNHGDVAAHVLLRMATLPDGQSCQVVLTDISERRLIEEALRVSEDRWKLALDAAGDGVWDWNVRTGDVMFSPRFAQLYGFEGDEYGSRLEDWSARIHPEDKLRTMVDIQAHLAGKTQSFSSEHRGHCKDGRWKWVLARGTVVSRGADGRALRLIGTHIDISNLKKTQAALRVASELQQAVFDALSSHIAVLNQQGHILQTNAAWQDFAKAQGFANPYGLPGARYFEVLEFLIGREHGAMLLAASQGIAAVIAGDLPSFQLEYSCQTFEEKRWFIMRVTPVLDEQGRVVVSHEDVTRLKAAELANLMLANVDFLTSALSRRHFLDVAEQEFSRSHRYNMPLMLMMLDLDHFKQINDQHGHDAGDAVLREFVQTVRAVLRESDVIGRLGGEEFAVLLPNTAREGGQALAERVVELVRESPVVVAGHPIHYTVSIGVSCLGRELSFAALLKRADTALYRAKSQGRDSVHMDVAASPFD